MALPTKSEILLNGYIFEGEPGAWLGSSGEDGLSLMGEPYLGLGRILGSFSKLDGISYLSVSKVNSVATGNIQKINGIDAQ